MTEHHLEHVQNAIVGSTVTTEGGDVLVNGQKVTNYFYSAQYQDLKAQADDVEQQFERTRRKIEQYPDDEDFKADCLRLSIKRNDIVKTLDDLKQEVIRLAETFTKIPINTKRLKLARQHFETGDYSAARAILDAEQMGNELDALLRRDERLQEEQAEIEALRIEKAHEFLILAKLISVDFTLADRFKQTLACFEQSLKASHTVENTFEYAYFLLEHNQFNAALPWYEEALAFYRRLAETNPQTYLPDVATTLNNLAILQSNSNDFAAARAAYDEALAIRRRLAEANPQAYLPNVAMTATNMSIFYLQALSDREKSLSYSREALSTALPFKEVLPAAQNYARTALQVVEAWGLNGETFLEEILQAADSE